MRGAEHSPRIASSQEGAAIASGARAVGESIVLVSSDPYILDQFICCTLLRYFLRLWTFSQHIVHGTKNIVELVRQPSEFFQTRWDEAK